MVLAYSVASFSKMTSLYPLKYLKKLIEWEILRPFLRQNCNQKDDN